MLSMPSRKQTLRQEIFGDRTMLSSAQSTTAAPAGALCLFQANLPSLHLSSCFLATPILLPAFFLVFCIYLCYRTNIKSPFLICQCLCYLANHLPLSSLTYSLQSGSFLTQGAPLSPRLSSSVVNPKGNYKFPRYAIGEVSGPFAFFFLCTYHSVWLWQY